jgi:hypothetical protein
MARSSRVFFSCQILARKSQIPACAAAMSCCLRFNFPPSYGSGLELARSLMPFHGLTASDTARPHHDYPDVRLHGGRDECCSLFRASELSEGNYWTKALGGGIGIAG